jgi:hypothetical protein
MKNTIPFLFHRNFLFTMPALIVTLHTLADRQVEGWCGLTAQQPWRGYPGLGRAVWVDGRHALLQHQ